MTVTNDEILFSKEKEEKRLRTPWGQGPHEPFFISKQAQEGVRLSKHVITICSAEVKKSP